MLIAKKSILVYTTHRSKVSFSHTIIAEGRENAELFSKTCFISANQTKSHNLWTEMNRNPVACRGLCCILSLISFETYLTNISMCSQFYSCIVIQMILVPITFVC